MANDTETTLLGSIFSTTTFVATTDGTHFSLQSTPRTNGAEVTTTNRLPVTTDGTVAISGTAAINIGQVAGSSILVGAGTAAGAVRIAFPTDQSLSGTITGTVAITGTPTVAVTGTVPVSGTIAVSGTSAVSGTVAATQSGAWNMDINGGVANALRGFISHTGSTAATIIAAQGSGVSIFVGSLQIANTSSTTAVITLNDSASTQLIAPAGSGNNPNFTPPLVVAANTALTATPNAATNALLMAAQGHK